MQFILFPYPWNLNGNSDHNFQKENVRVISRRVKVESMHVLVRPCELLLFVQKEGEIIGKIMMVCWLVEQGEERGAQR